MNLPISELLFIAILTVLEGFFVASEIALVSIRRSRVEQLVEEGNRGARRVRKLLDDPGRFLAVAQIGLTFLGFFASAYAAVSLTDRLTGLLEGVAALREYAAGISLVIVTVLLAMFTIVFGELVPKTLALAFPERFALAVSRPIDVHRAAARAARRAAHRDHPGGHPAVRRGRRRGRARSPPRSSASSSSGAASRASSRPRRSR